MRREGVKGSRHPLILGTTLAGLEDVALDEVSAKLAHCASSPCGYSALASPAATSRGAVRREPLGIEPTRADGTLLTQAPSSPCGYSALANPAATPRGAVRREPLGTVPTRADGTLLTQGPSACEWADGAGRGKAFFRAAPDMTVLGCLRTVDNLYVRVWRGPVGPHRVDLAALESGLARSASLGASLGAACTWVEELRGRPSVYVNASRVGKHSYSRFEAAAAALKGLLAARQKWRAGEPQEHDLEFRLDILHAEAALYLRLTPPAFRYRGDERAFSQAALRPTVAHGLVWLSKPEPGEVFLDPFCGSGTIAIERAHYPAAGILAGDIAPEAATAAQLNAVAAGANVLVRTWDARSLPIEAGSVDKVVTNLPFGRQVLTEPEIAELYLATARELARVMKPKGCGLLLTDRRTELEDAADAAGLGLTIDRQLSLRGLHPWLFRLTKA